MRSEFMSEYILLFIWFLLTIAQLVLITKTIKIKNLMNYLMILNLLTLWVINVFGMFELTDLSNLASLNISTVVFTSIIFFKALK
ncbi:MAG TPA: hypothetical protein PLJ21_09390, partial [Pseudobdellovibrionaceae bacterium]|nr:hypothetical protein [Pseudobdellovibrionaceae bacterium]